MKTETSCTKNSEGEEDGESLCTVNFSHVAKGIQAHLRCCQRYARYPVEMFFTALSPRLQEVSV